jgi:preprotein translocase subunit YajC
MTMGGIFGRISHLDDEVVDLEVSSGTSLRVARSAISRKVEV